MKVIEKAANILKADIENKTVLEVACGSADLSVVMSNTAKSVKCIDLVDFRLSPSVFDCKNVEFKVMDATKMTFHEDVFDTAVIYNAAYHIKDEFAQILSECTRVVKSGGTIRLLSSFSIDLSAIENVVIPILQKEKIKFTVENFGGLISVDIRV